MSDLSPRKSLLATAEPSRLTVRSGEVKSGLRDYLAFALGEERYALPLSVIREIVKVPPITEVPLAPPHIMGIVSVRGRVTTLIDTRRLLKTAKSQPTSRARVLLVDRGDEVVGLFIDRILRVYRLNDDEIELASAVGGDLEPYVAGIGRPGTSELRSEERGELESKERQVRLQTASSAELALEAEILVLLDPVALLKG